MALKVTGAACTFSEYVTLSQKQITIIFTLNHAKKMIFGLKSCESGQWWWFESQLRPPLKLRLFNVFPSVWTGVYFFLQKYKALVGWGKNVIMYQKKRKYIRGKWRKNGENGKVFTVIGGKISFFCGAKISFFEQIHIYP